MDKKTYLTKLRDLLLALKEALLTLYSRNMETQTIEGQKIYEIAAQELGKHLTLNQNVPNDLGCAEALSTVLAKAGVQGIPVQGFEGTAELYTFLDKSLYFREVDSPLPGDIIISPTGKSTKGSLHGHCGVVAQHGILSNDSNTGLWRELFTLASWQQYYVETLGFPVLYYRAF